MTMTATPQSHSVTAADGTTIAYVGVGSGPPLVLVHGAMSDSTRWRITPYLSRFRTVYAMDRRGRGDSGDAPDWSLDLEVDDVVAVVEAVAATHGAPADLLGHSLGGLLTLRAATRTPQVRRLVVYEAAVDEEAQPAAVIAGLQAMIDEGRPDDAVTAVMREVVQVPEGEIRMLRAQPTWPARVATAPTLPRELGVPLRLGPDEAARVCVPTLVIGGAASPAEMQASVRWLAETVPGARLEMIPEQHHVADQVMPEEFAAMVLEFLRERE